MKLSAFAIALLSVFPLYAGAHPVPPKTPQAAAEVTVSDDDLTSDTLAEQLSEEERRAAKIDADLIRLSSVLNPQPAVEFDCSRMFPKLKPKQIVFKIVPSGPRPVADLEKLRRRNPNGKYHPEGTAQYGPQTFNSLKNALCIAGLGMRQFGLEHDFSVSWLESVTVRVVNELREANAAVRVAPGLDSKPIKLREVDIEVTLGLLAKQLPQDQLAGVFSHEFSHVILNHGWKKVGRKVVGAGLVAGGAGVAIAKIFSKSPMGIAVGLGVSAIGLATLSCDAAEGSLITEQDADIIGVYALANVLGSVENAQKAFVGYLEDVAKRDDKTESCYRDGNQNPHPAASIRIKAVQTLELQSVRD